MQRIEDWDTFHRVFEEAFGFPEYYGRNMNAWIDCMTYLNDPAVADTTLKAPRNEIVVLQLDDYAEFAQRCPEQQAALIEGSAFVNWRRFVAGESPVIALAFSK